MMYITLVMLHESHPCMNDKYCYLMVFFDVK